MTLALIVLGTLLAVAAVGSAIQKLRRDPRVVASVTSVGVKESQFSLLASLEVLGAAGLLLGIWAAPLGVAAAAGLTLYFLGAVLGHVRARQRVADMAPAAVLTLVAAATLALELARA